MSKDTRPREEQHEEVEEIVRKHTDAEIKFYTRDEAENVPKNSWDLLAIVRFDDSDTMDVINSVKDDLDDAEYLAVMQEIYGESVLSISTTFEAGTKGIDVDY